MFSALDVDEHNCLTRKTPKTERVLGGADNGMDNPKSVPLLKVVSVETPCRSLIEVGVYVYRPASCSR